MSVVVPAYNEELRIGEMLDECLEFLREEYGEQSSLHPVDLTRREALEKWEEGERRKGEKKLNGTTGNGSVGRLEEEEVKGWEILIVDDGSKDKTTEVVMQWMRQRVAMGHMRPGDLRICHLEKNRGKGGAVTHVCFIIAIRCPFCQLALCFNRGEKTWY